MTYDRRVQPIVLKYVGVFETQLRARCAPTMFLDPSSGSWKGTRQEDYEDFRR
ncbi:hypothetical protein QUW41_06955 [Slackia piriformis]|nr:hypothetical protein [Slackia piriformis]